MSLIKKIKNYYKKGFDKKNTLFTTPSHEQGKFLPVDAQKLLGENFFKCDFSEIEGFDNLRNPNGILKNVIDKFSQIYKSKQTFLLTNGSTSGIIAMMMATLKEGEKVLIARNCHISIYNALVLTGASPVWFMPDYDEEWGIYKGITKEQISKILQQNKDIKAVIITSPTYEGLFSDIEGIAEICKKHKAKLLVDEAHGALLNFGDFKTKPAILCGADISVQSLHKTAGAPNPCALLHIAKSSNLSPSKVQDCLNLINTTSPSYPLILATEICVDYLNSKKGKSDIQKLLSQIETEKSKCSSEIKVYEGFSDPTKILIKLVGIKGYDASKFLNERCFIEEEFSNDKSMLFISGIGTSYAKLRKLFSCLEKFSTTSSKRTNCDKEEHVRRYELPQIKYTPRDAMQKEYELLPIKEAIGKICAETLIEYPPGIPIIYAGEVITENTTRYIKNKMIKVCK